MESVNDLRKEFESIFGRPAKRVFTACGRSELVGNHTDHQHGLVLACGVNLSALALAAPFTADCAPLDGKAAFYLCEGGACRLPAELL